MRSLQLIVAAFVLTLTTSTALAAEPSPKKLLLIGQSPDGHPPQTHEYLPGLKRLAERLAELLEPHRQLDVRLVNADEPWSDGPELLAGADGAVLFLSEGAKWCQADPRRYEALTKLAARGGGLVALHWALGTKSAEPIGPYLKLLGGCHGGPDRKYQVVETELSFIDHPIVRGLAPIGVRDEFYYRLKFAPGDSVHPIAQATIDGRPETVAWIYERPDGGRSAGFSGLHFHDNWERPEYRALVSREVLWTLQLPLD